MSLKIILLFFLFTMTSARPGFSNTGMHFVLSIPQNPTKSIQRNLLFVTLFTEEEYVTVEVIRPTTLSTTDRGVTKRMYRVERHATAGFSLEDHLRYHETSTGRAISITSSGPIRVFVVATPYYMGNKDDRTMLNVLPKESCGKSYYVNVDMVYNVHFLSVMAFEADKTKVQVKIPLWEGKGLVTPNCNANTTCVAGGAVEFTLNKYQYWCLKNWGNGSIHNTYVNSDNIIYVLTNSHLLMNTNRKGPFITSMLPVETWGKEYVTFHLKGNTVQQKVFMFSAQKLPLKLKYIDSSSASHKDLEFQKSCVYTVRISEDSISVFRSIVPFSLTEFLHEVGDRLNIIPTEQWMHAADLGRFSLTLIPADLNMTYFILTNAKKVDVIATDPDLSLKWYDVRTEGYSLAGVDSLPARNSFVRTLTPGSKMVVYIRLYMSWGEPGVHFMTAPLDFYLGRIYQWGCFSSKPGLDDGIDNDCDGFVDEEIENDLDDDGDGEVDEDIVEKHVDGTWKKTDPADVCMVLCGNTPRYMSARTCIRSRFGKECNGVAFSGDNATESLECDMPPNGMNTACYCPKRCFDKDNGCPINPLLCGKCPPGIQPSGHCMNPCPRGWAGSGCSKSRPVERIQKNDKETKNSQMVGVILVFLWALVGLIIGMDIYWVFVKFCLGKLSQEADNRDKISGKSDKAETTQITNETESGEEEAYIDDVVDDAVNPDLHDE